MYWRSCTRARSTLSAVRVEYKYLEQRELLEDESLRHGDPYPSEGIGIPSNVRVQTA